MESKQKNTYILITQCLQNAFFLDDENRLCLPREVAVRVLVGEQDIEDISIVGQPDDTTNHRKISANQLRGGPLYRFLDAATADSQREGPLHILHIRDWHAPSPDYDEERRLYGPHCEAHTWGAEPVAGLERFLAPWGTAHEAEARRMTGYRCRRQRNSFKPDPAGNLVFYDVRSDSVFDFKRPTSTELRTDLIASGYPQGSNASQLHQILDHLIGLTEPGDHERVYVVVIGVYTDIKVKALLMGLRSRYAIDGLFVSDVLAEAPTLERHLSALDFSARVINTQVIHSLNELAGIVNPGTKTVIPQRLIENSLSYRDYSTYFLDRQNVLSFQDQRLSQYLDLTGKRSADVYTQIYQANWYLLRIGYIFMGLTVIAAALRVVGVDVPDSVLLTTGVLSAGQIIGSFFVIPRLQMRENLTSLVRLRNYLETYSNISALLRHHLTQIDRLQPSLKDADPKLRAEHELRLLKEQLAIIYEAAEEMGKSFHDLTAQPIRVEPTPEEKKPESPPPDLG